MSVATFTSQNSDIGSHAMGPYVDVSGRRIPVCPEQARSGTGQGQISVFSIFVTSTARHVRRLAVKTCLYLMSSSQCSEPKLSCVYWFATTIRLIASISSIISLLPAPPCFGSVLWNTHSPPNTMNPIFRKLYSLYLSLETLMIFRYSLAITNNKSELCST